MATVLDWLMGWEVTDVNASQENDLKLAMRAIQTFRAINKKYGKESKNLYLKAVRALKAEGKW